MKIPRISKKMWVPCSRCHGNARKMVKQRNASTGEVFEVLWTCSGCGGSGGRNEVVG